MLVRLILFSISELTCKGVVELLHGDSAVTVVIELPHETVLLVVGHVDVHAIT